ncbi:hypothetical protein Y1Q_0000323 [Alligator mississippiensis]|uniref:Uncharacterized protein n=1 Tax=Alligator mississippiensis TaxID=8496 RepID=A0A151LZ84_ALLMI|nr:hypothetical protein Y1Q_0000323 [Alligator mississippiensis]
MHHPKPKPGQLEPQSTAGQAMRGRIIAAAAWEPPGPQLSQDRESGFAQVCSTERQNDSIMANNSRIFFSSTAPKSFVEVRYHVFSC